MSLTAYMDMSGHCSVSGASVTPATQVVIVTHCALTRVTVMVHSVSVMKDSRESSVSS